MVKIAGLDLAPILVPLERRIQTLAVAFYCGLYFSPLFLSIIYIACLFTPLYWLVLAHVAWIFYDFKIRQTSSRGGRRWSWLRRHVFWNYFRDYFPCTLKKTADLDPTKNYLFATHPHGIIGCGAFANFGSEATNFSGLFPGITPHPMTLKANFMWPLFREFLLMMGGCDVSKESIAYLLTKHGTGNAAIVIVGGAEEALNSRPGNYLITLKKRKGFVKMAIKTGASLVPVFTFGENGLFAQLDNPTGSNVRRFQEKFKGVFGCSPPLYYGRGVFNYTFGFLPHRKPIHTVVGPSLDVERCESPTQEMVDDLHNRYMDELASLFDKYKADYGLENEKKLIFV